jgi:hypothetical protein
MSGGVIGKAGDSLPMSICADGVSAWRRYPSSLQLAEGYARGHNYLRSARKSQESVKSHSRCTVRKEMPRNSAVSSAVRPPK